jgi:hypothetical protein
MLLANLFAAAALAGCTTSTEPEIRDIQGVFPARGRTMELPFVVSDQLGLIKTVSLAEPRIDDGVTQVTGRGDAIYLQWTGGMCDRQVSIVFDRTLDGPVLGVATERGFGGCLLAGIARTLRLDLSEPLDASTVAFALRQ